MINYAQAIMAFWLSSSSQRKCNPSLLGSDLAVDECH
jgi:hypothetical protein